jgi:hypothetical protein
MRAGVKVPPQGEELIEYMKKISFSKHKMIDKSLSKEVYSTFFSFEL